MHVPACMNAHVAPFWISSCHPGLPREEEGWRILLRRGEPRSAPTPDSGDQHPPTEVVWPQNLASSNSRGPQGDPWPPARAAHTLDARPTRQSAAAHRGPRRTRAARARDSTSPRHHGSSPGPVLPPPPSRRARQPDFSLTAAPASPRPALRAGWSAEPRPAADWLPSLLVWPHFPPLRPRLLPIGQEEWSRQRICQNS